MPWLGVVKFAGSAGSWHRAEDDDVAQSLPRLSLPGRGDRTRGVSAQLVSDDHTRDILQALQQLAEEALCGFGIASALDQDVEHMAVLVSERHR